MKNLIKICALSLFLVVFLIGCNGTETGENYAEPRAGEIDGRGEDLPKTEETKSDEPNVEGEMTVTELIKQFNEDNDSLKDKEIIISGNYMGTSEVESDGKKKITVSVQQENGIASVDCVVKEKPDEMKSFDKIKVKGKFVGQDGLGLVFDPCEIIK